MFHSAHGIRVKLVPNWKESMLYTKSLQVLHRKGISMLTSLKVSSLTRKYMYFTDQNLMQKRVPMELNFAGLEMKIPMDRA